MAQREKEGTSDTGDFIGKLIELVNELKGSPGGVSHHGTSEKAVVAQGAIFLLAGFETTSKSLSVLTYMLAKHPEVQQRIYEEILENMSCVEDIQYETVQNLKYMEAAMQENLRMHPPVPKNQRLCTSDVTINGRFKTVNVDEIITKCSHNRLGH